MRYAEHLLASGIGAASSRLVLSLLLRKRTVSTQAALKLLDDANAAIHYNREVLQTALDQVRQGIAVFDNELHLICWNRQFGEILDLPPSVVRVGATLAEMLRFNAEHGAFGEGEPDALVAGTARSRLRDSAEPFFERFPERNLVVEVRSDKMPGGGIVTTLTDITPSVEAAEALERANASLEGRVRERTRELERLNGELLSAKAVADDANISKTRFLAAASHDLLQPLNAARLYVTSLVERQGGGENATLIGNIDASLDAVEEILGALLDISRLDSGVMKPEIASFRIDEILRQLEVEFAPLAREKGLKLKFMPSSLTVTSDRRLLRRLLQNLVSNAVKYTLKGRVLVGCRRSGDRVRIEVIDTGIGIPKSKQRVIFQEFHRLEQGARVARGLGLGLSIVERIARVLDHTIELESALGRGSQFTVEAPCAPPRAAVARAPHAATRRVRPAHRHARSVHRQRTENSRGHVHSARRLGLRRTQGSGTAGGAGANAPEDAAAWDAGRLSSRRRQRSRCDPRVAPAVRRPARDLDHRRPRRETAQGSGSRQRAGALQADQAGVVARARSDQSRVQRIAAAE